jgi:PAS domain-containing protein
MTKEAARSKRQNARPERFRAADAAGAPGSFEYDLNTKKWVWTPSVAQLLGLNAGPDADRLQRAVFVDDVPKIIAALDAARENGFYVEFRVMRDGIAKWLAGRGQVDGNVLRGMFYDIDERKQLEARLLAANETLEARVRSCARKLTPSKFSTARASRLVPNWICNG